MSLAKMHNALMLRSETERQGAEREETKREHTTETGQPGTVVAITIYREIGLLLPVVEDRMAPPSRATERHARNHARERKNRKPTIIRAQTHTRKMREEEKNNTGVLPCRVRALVLEEIFYKQQSTGTTKHELTDIAAHRLYL